MNSKEILKYAIWTGIYATLLIPFVVLNNMFFPYITGKAFVFRIIVEIIFGLWLILIIKDKEFRPKWSWILGTAGIFTFVLLLADMQAVAPFKAFWSNFERMEGWVTFIHLLAYILVISSMLNQERLWLWFFRANVSVGVILAITSIDKSTEVRFSGPLGNPIYIAVYFLFVFFFALILLYKDVLTKNLTDWKVFKNVFVNVLFYLYVFAAVLSLYVVYSTSRGALLGAIGGILVAAIFIAIFEKKRKVIRQLALGGIVLVIAVVVVFIGARNTQFVKSNPTLSRLAEISWSNINGQARQLIWPMAIKGFQEKPILGWGQEGFNYVFNKYYDPRMYNQEQWFDRAHNAPLDFLVAGGILGLLSYLALFGSALFLLWFRRNNFSITEKGLLTGLLAGYLFQAIFVFDNLVSYIMFFTTLAYIHSGLTKGIEEIKALPNNKKGGPAPEVKYFLAGFVEDQEYQNYIMIPLIVILTGVAVWFVNVPGYQANVTLIQALRLTSSGRVADGLTAYKKALAYNSVGGAEVREQLLSITPSVLQAKEIDQTVKKEFLTLTVTEIEKQISSVPNDARYYILMGSLLNNIGSLEQALIYLKKAVELSPKKQTMRFALIQNLFVQGKIAEAVAEAKIVYELEKNYDQAINLYRTMVQKQIEIKPSFKTEGEQILKDLMSTTTTANN